MTSSNSPIIKPSEFNLPKVEKNVVLFCLLNHFFLFKELVSGSQAKSFGPAKRFGFEKNGKRCTALGGFIGAPISAIILENAIESGGGKFSAFGTAGSFIYSRDRIGQYVRPRSGIDRTGMMKDYGADEDVIVFDKELKHQGTEKVVSVNSFYRLTPRKMDEYREKNISLIDMEAVPLAYIARSKGMKFHPHFIVSDVITESNSWINGSKQSQFKDGLEKGLNQLVDSL